MGFQWATSDATDETDAGSEMGVNPQGFEHGIRGVIYLKNQSNSNPTTPRINIIK